MSLLRILIIASLLVSSLSAVVAQDDDPVRVDSAIVTTASTPPVTTKIHLPKVSTRDYARIKSGNRVGK